MPLLPLTRSVMLLALAALGGACYEPQPDPRAASPSCSGCHGERDAPAPPPGLWLSGGKTDPGDPGVGAHHAHLVAGATAAATPCETCHRVPAAVGDPGHMDSPLPAEVVFSGVAVAGGTKASWDGSTCVVYCHSSKLGATVPRPKWTVVKSTVGACVTCHGSPPGGSHPAVTDCSICHDEVVDAQGKIKNVALHVNGQLEAKGGPGGCSACHGGPDNAAPPVDTQGGSAETARGVGAHQAHVRGTARHAPMGCDECHVNPTAISDPGHLDTPLPAEVVFGALAKTGGRAPVWSTITLSCAAVYCHALDGGGNPQPAWNTGERMVCGSCHGLPPLKGRSGAPHPTSSVAECAGCHAAVVDGAGKIIDASRHVDGKVDVNN